MSADESFDDYVLPPEPAELSFGDRPDSGGSTRFERGGRSNFNRGRDDLSEYRTPPHDERAERSVLGAMLLNQDVVVDIVDRLHAEDFYFPAHQLIFRAIVDLYSDASEIDVLIVSGRLDRLNQLERVGGAPYLHLSLIHI